VESTIMRSHANVSLTAVVAGGLAGASGFGAIAESYAAGTITGGDNAVLGGLIGENFDSSISQSFANVDVAAGRSSTVGGLLGAGGGIANSYSTGAVSAHNESKIGGFLGELYGYGGIQYSYENGHVEGAHSGGFLGQFSQGASNVFTNYWDMDTSGKTKRHCSGDRRCVGHLVRGLTTAEFKSGLPEGFDPSIWGQSVSINNGYPYLLANPPPQ